MERSASRRIAVLDRPHRLTSTSGFTAATRAGRRAGTRTVVLHLAGPTSAMDRTAGGDSLVRVGFVVGRAVGNAVHRNRVRRRLRHLAAARLAALPPGSVLVVRALPASASATYDALGRDFDVALRRLAPVGPAGGGVA